MTDQERAALIELWGLVPGTRPPEIGFEYPDDESSRFCDMDEVHRVSPRRCAALSRDAIVEWLHDNGCSDVATRQDPERPHWWMVNCTMRESDDMVQGGAYESDGTTTRLLALIAAARAVAGKGGEGVRKT